MKDIGLEMREVRRRKDGTRRRIRRRGGRGTNTGDHKFFSKCSGQHVVKG